MAFNDPIDKKKSAFRSKNDVRVKRSYYTFSKEYPIGNIGREKKKRNKKLEKERRLRVTVSIICFAVIVCLSYFLVSFGLNISNKSPDENNVTASSPDSSPVTNALSLDDGVKALYMPYNKLSDKNYINDFIGKIKRKNANSVVIDFKTESGRLAYTSKEKLAILGKCSIFDNDTIRRAIAAFTNENINVIAGVYCFEDETIPTVDESLAVKYLDTNVNWLDGLTENGGKPWLNPYSKAVRNYIISIISELNAMNIKGFILESVQFPDGDNIKNATFSGEKSKKTRNTILNKFVDSVKESLPADCFVLIGETVNDTLSGNENIYGGLISNNAADGVCADTFVRPASYIIDKRTHYSSIFSLFLTVTQTLDENDSFMPQINFNEYSWSYFRAMKKNGYKNFLLFDETGEY